MTAIQVRDIKHGVRLGKLIDLRNDYRTRAIVRTTLPDDILLAMSSVAFQQHIEEGPAEEMQARLQSLCDSLRDALGGDGKPSQPDFAFKVRGKDGRTENHSLKVEWLDPNKYGVILLPQEHVSFAPSQDHHRTDWALAFSSSAGTGGVATK